MGEPDGSESTELSFGAAMEELEAVLHRIEGDEIDIDQLGAELGRAATLLEVCRTKIRRAEVEVQQIVAKIEEDEPVAGDTASADAGAESGRAARTRGGRANRRDVEPDPGPDGGLHRSYDGRDDGRDHGDDELDLDAAREQGNLLGQDDDIPF